MPPIIPDVVPDHFPAGTTVKFTRSLDDFLPSDGWTYAIYLNGLTQKFNNGTGEVYDITGDELVINIEPNVASAAVGVFNTWEERTLAVVEAAISGRLTSDIQAYQIAGRSVSKIPIAELRTIRGELKASIWRQNNPGQLGVPYRVAFALENESPDYPPTWQDVTGLDR